MEISAYIWQARAVTHRPVSSAFEASVGSIHNTSEKNTKNCKAAAQQTEE